MICTMVLFLAGCGSQMKDVLEGTNYLSEKCSNIMSEREQNVYLIPNSYEKVSESGKVSFHLNPEYPESISNGACIVPDVRGRIYANTDAAYKMFVNDRTIDKIIDDDEESADKPKEVHFILQDGATVTYGRDVNYADVNKSKYYINTQYREDSQLCQFPNKELLFLSKEEGVEKIRGMLSDIGISPEIFHFSVVALDHETLKRIEESLLEEGLIETNQKKNDWSESDDAYYIYAYQEEKDITIFNENMSVIREFADDGPANAAFYALLTSEGIVNFQTSFVYDLDWNQEAVELKPFEQIADTVEQKYEMILNDAVYEVTRARFALEISLDERQRYQAIPIWYFEVTENDVMKSIVWVNAVTGKEIYLQ